MTNLVDLPEEILIIIIKELDFKSAYNLHTVCDTLRNIVFMQGVIRKCNLSCNTLATPKSLQLNMIKNISGHLHELNVCGVNLKKSTLLPALKKMKCLKTLDVSYTHIDIIDMLDLYANCSSIKNLTINFSVPVEFELTDKLSNSFQEVFKNFINIHFVVRTKLLNLLEHILKKSTLDTLKLTLCDIRVHAYKREEINIPCSFKHFCVFMMHNEPYTAYQGTWNEIIPLIKMENVEYIVLEYNDAYSIWISPMFMKFFSDNFKVTPLVDFDQNKKMYGTVAIFVWDKKTTIFDKLFFYKLKIRIKEILACELKVTSQQTLPLDIDTLCYDSFHIYPMEEVGDKSKRDYEVHFKKRRIVHNDQILDYDKIFKEHNNIKLNMYIPHSINITLSPTSEYLRKLTYLSLAGSLVRYSNEFFNVLFRCCKKLITLNVEASPLSPCSSSIMRSIPLSQSLKNIRLVDKRIDFKTLFSSFTQCKTLENIYVIDNSHEYNDLADLVVLYQCVNLYTVRMQAEIRKYTHTKMTTMIKTLQERSEHYINFVVEYSSPIKPVPYDPYLNVFNLKPIKPV